jgi:quinoprotein glucose dehydrogenase
MIEMAAPQPRPTRPPRIFAGLLFLIGAVLAAGGTQLALLDGSLYYAVAGLALVFSAILLWLGRRLGAWLYLLVLLGTWAWAFWEVGLDGWQLMPRVLLLTVLGLWLLTPWARRGLA